MESVDRRAFAYRIDLSQVCKRAGVSRTIATRWKAGTNTPSLATIAKLERVLNNEAQMWKAVGEFMA